MKNTTYAALAASLPAFTGKLPRPETLQKRRDDGIGVCHVETIENPDGNSAIITLFTDGTALFEYGGEQTALSVAECGNAPVGYEFPDKYTRDVFLAELREQPWRLVLTMHGQLRTTHNQESREEGVPDFHLEQDSFDWNDMPSERDFVEVAVEEDDEREYRDSLRKAMVAGIAKLTDTQCKIVEMRYLKGMRRAEIAAHLGIGEESVKEHLARAMKKIRKNS